MLDHPSSRPDRNVMVPRSLTPTSTPRSSDWTKTADSEDAGSAVDELVALARMGLLASRYQEASREERLRLNGAAMELAWPVVFHRLTRRHELRRGHWSCAQAVHLLADACLDRFHDDLEAVVHDIFTHARTNVANLEGWIAVRLQAATVNGHRRRRGARGALQRPRLPVWLAQALGPDPWRRQLAIEILVWVGVPTTAGVSLWPLDTWTERRAAATGDWSGSDAMTVEREIESVLSVMRRRPRWYSDHVDRPLGAKAPPVVATPVDAGDWLVEAGKVADHNRVEEARVTELASLALAAIDVRRPVGGDLRMVVASVMTEVFGEVDLEHELAELPYSAQHVCERVAALVTDSTELDRIVGVVCEILGGNPTIGRENE